MAPTRTSDFAAEFAARLDERGLSQADLARQLGVSGATVSGWATGTKRPGAANADAIEEALDVRPRGRFRQLLGYAAPDQPGEPMTLEDHIRAEPTLDGEDKRALLRFLEHMRREQP